MQEGSNFVQGYFLEDYKPIIIFNTVIGLIHYIFKYASIRSYGLEGV